MELVHNDAPAATVRAGLETAHSDAYVAAYRLASAALQGHVPYDSKVGQASFGARLAEDGSSRAVIFFALLDQPDHPRELVMNPAVFTELQRPDVLDALNTLALKSAGVRQSVPAVEVLSEAA